MELSMMVEHGDVGDARHNLVEDYRKSLENVAAERTALNVVLAKESLEDVYRELFSGALAAYNEAQVAKGKPGRRIPDYLAHVRASRQERPEYEMVVQIGNRETNPAADAACRELSEAVYRDWLAAFRKEFPQLKVREAVVHMDEATPHLHVKYVPWSSGNKRGLETRNSLGGALRQMGYARTQDVNHRYMRLLEEAGAAHGVERLEMGVSRARMSVENYKAAMRRGENLDYSNDPALIQAVLESQETIREMERVVGEYREALEYAAVAKVVNHGEARRRARAALDRNESALDAVREKVAQVKELFEVVKERVRDFVLNPVPRHLQEESERREAQMRDDELERQIQELRDEIAEQVNGRLDPSDKQGAVERAEERARRRSAPAPAPRRSASLDADARAASSAAHARQRGERGRSRSR